MKSTDMKQTPETRKNFEDGWDAIFNKEEQRTIKDSLTVAMGEVVSHLRGEIELPSRVNNAEKVNGPEPKKPEVVKTFESIMEALGARFIDCPPDVTEEDSK